MREFLTVHLPETSDDEISEQLIELTERITKVTGEENGYGLGGRFGYGENFENEVFMMHRFCWCERSDCAWCRCCNCAGDDGCGPPLAHCPPWA